MTQKSEMERTLDICGQLMASTVVAVVAKYKTECDMLKTVIEQSKTTQDELIADLKEATLKLTEIEAKKWIESGKWKDEIDQEKSKYVLDKLYRCTNKYDGSVIIGKAWYKESSPCKGWNFSYDEGSFNEHHCEKIEPYDGVDTKKENDEVSDECEETSNWFDKIQECEMRIANLEDMIDRYKKHCDSLNAEISIRNDRIAELDEENKRLRNECIARRESEEDFKWERDQYKKERDEFAALVGKEKDDNIEGECDERIADLEDRIDLYKKHCESLTAEISTKNNRIKELEEGLRKWKAWCLEWKAQCLELKYPCEEKECEG